MTAILVALAVVALIAVFGTANGVAVWAMWAWFMVPLGVPPVGLAHAVGLSATVGLLVKARYKQEQELRLGEQIAVALLAPAVMTLYGWIVHAIMVA